MKLFGLNIGKIKISKKDLPKDLVNEMKSDDGHFGKQVNRNNKAQNLEKKGNIDSAIKLYEENVAENFEGSLPYNRLAIIYRKRKDYNNEIRVLNKAISIYSQLDKSSPRPDIKPKLNKFKVRLNKALSLEKTKTD